MMLWQIDSLRQLWKATDKVRKEQEARSHTDHPSPTSGDGLDHDGDVYKNIVHIREGEVREV
jgi:hypothetical protein